MNKLNNQQKLIIISAVLLLVIGCANYFNYYAPPFPTEKILSFSEMSPSQRAKLFRDSQKAKYEDDFSPKNIGDAEVGNTNTDESTDTKTTEKNAVSQAELGENYLNYAVDSSGNLVRWNKNKITVFVSPSEYRDTIYKALSEYNSIFGEYFKFYTVDTRTKADIKIDIVNSFNSNDNSDEIYMAGITKNNFSGDKKYLIGSLIQILSTKPNSKRKVTQKEVYNVALHEIGHALGIIGHSPNKNDVLYAASNISTLSPRDIATLKIMYSNNENIIKKETKNFAETKLNEAISYAKASPNKALSWVNLGRVYYDVGKKDEALNAYKKALVIEPNNPLVYQSMAECYYASQKYDIAIKYYEITLSKIQNDEEKVLINNMIGMCYAKKENFEKAYEYFSKAFNADKNNKMLLKNYLVACVETNRKAEAITAINQYSSKHPDINNEDFVKDVIKWAK